MIRWAYSKPTARSMRTLMPTLPLSVHAIEEGDAADASGLTHSVTSALRVC